MAREFKGEMSIGAHRFAIVVSGFNDYITSRLREGAVDALKQHGCHDDNITVAHVPGAFEIPVVAKKLVDSAKFSAVICLGCVIRGQTPHFDYVAGEAAKGVAQVALSSGIPVTFGVITADTPEQAIDRAGGKFGNKGIEAATSAIEMVNLFEKLNAAQKS